LIRLHAGRTLESDVRRIAAIGGRVEAQQFRDPRLLRRVIDDAFFKTTPKVFPKLRILCGLVEARSSSRSTNVDQRRFDLLDGAVICRSSRDTFSGKSDESTNPRMKRRYGGSSSAALSMMNTA